MPGRRSSRNSKGAATPTSEWSEDSMSGGSRREREERAVDALLVSILRRVDKDDDIVEPEKLPQLTEEEKAAMNNLGPDFLDRILAGERPVPRKPKQDRPNESEDVALAG